MFKKIYSTKLNIFASLAGQSWTALLGLVFVPVYLHYIGVESYGLIGIFLSLQVFLNLLDFGISPTLNRELARLSVSRENAQEMHDLYRTLQVPNWLSAATILLILCALSPLLANYWVNPKELSTTTVTQAFLLISFCTAVQFLSAFNTGGLVGLQKQVLLNSISVFSGTLRSVGAWVVLAFVSPTIQAFLWWQLAAAVIHTLLTGIALRKSLFYSEHKGRFRKELLDRVWRFAAAMTGTGFLALILTQTDKIILSRMLNLEDFGYYSLAATICSMATGTIIGAVNNVVYPKLSSLVSLGDEAAVRNYYHRGCQIMSAFLVPTIVIFAFFSYEIIFIWTRKTEVAEHTYLLLTLVVIGTGLNGLMMLPYHLQLSYNWTSLGIYLLIASILTVVPLMILGIYFYGVYGGIAGWIIYNGLNGIVMITLMHRRILRGEQWRWFFKDILPPVLIAVTFVAVIYFLFGDYLASSSLILQILILGAVSLTTFLVCALSLGSVRNAGLKQIFGYE